MYNSRMQVFTKDSAKKKPAWLRGVYTNDNAPLSSMNGQRPDLKKIDGAPISWAELAGETDDMTMAAISWDDLV